MEQNEAELGRSKKSGTPGEHLAHLLNIGWAPSSLLVQKYVAKYALHNELSQWQKNNEQSGVRAKLSEPAPNKKPAKRS